MFPLTLEGSVALGAADRGAVVAAVDAFLHEARATAVETAPDDSIAFRVSWNRMPPMGDPLASVRSGTVAVVDAGDTLSYRFVLTRGIWFEIGLSALIWLLPPWDGISSVVAFIGFVAMFLCIDYAVAAVRLPRFLKRAVALAGSPTSRTSAST